jgi:SnoaL-like domain
LTQPATVLAGADPQGLIPFTPVKNNPVRSLTLSVSLVAASGLVLPGARLGAQSSIDGLARDVERAEAIRAVKVLQRTYAQYAQYGLWNEMAGLFADEASLTLGDDSAKGRSAIAAFLTTRLGGGRQGLAPGAIHTQLIDEPVVNLSVDGTTAKGRWYGFFLLGDGRGSASLEGGVYENDYVKQNGVWKIAALHFYPQYAGSYETGWTNWKGQDLPIVPYHYNADESGIPIPPPVGPAPASKASLAQLEQRIAVMNAEDEVRNLQASYGYYVDRRMWDDVTDLFTEDGMYEVGGVGVYAGPKGVRKALERMGPAGLTHGVLNDRLQFDTVVTIAAGERDAHVRGIELGMLGEADKGEAFWEVNVFDNRFVKEGGIWKIREMRVFPVLRSDYAQGWGRSRIIERAPAGALAPDRPVPASDAADQGRIIPAFHSSNPGTGRRVAAPNDWRVVATAPLTGAVSQGAPRIPSPDRDVRLKDDVRRLARSTAYDGAENVSSTYGQLIDDFQWPQMAAIFGKRGAKQIPFAGYYSGADRIAHALDLEYGGEQAARASIAFHWRIQPVIHVAADGRSARVRTYLFHPNTSKQRGDLFGAMYPDDHLILEDGIWRLWNLSLDEPYFSMPNWKGGWSAAKDRPTAQASRRAGAEPPREAPPPPPAAGRGQRPQRYFGAALVAKYAPDIAITVLGERQEHFRGGTGEPWEWPAILPMWWGYRNPVSGRTPDLFLPDCVPCDYAPDLSMTRHGYLLPASGPAPTDD